MFKTQEKMNYSKELFLIPIFVYSVIFIPFSIYAQEDSEQNSEDMWSIILEWTT